ncbi:hypothetical protein E2C01_008990 [Portunus trituberculatus]|uniref:Uncharacterized protein n=1 Tax=Portunus trituberculatus TaxID=210409 RepID=A0A5B7D3H0_PORTR|nr:hypothetical protein [Portunus trituberculatus]
MVFSYPNLKGFIGDRYVSSPEPPALKWWEERDGQVPQVFRDSLRTGLSSRLVASHITMTLTSQEQ